MEELIFNRKQNGQSLIEALIALGAATVIVSAIAIGVISAVNNSDATKYQNLATTYAQQGLEIISGQSKSDWANFHTLGGSANPYAPITYCFDQGKLIIKSSDKLLNGTNCTANIGINTNNPSYKFFIRQVSIVASDPICTGTTPTDRGDHVVISVLWNDGKCTSNTYCHKVDVNSCYANIITLPTP